MTMSPKRPILAIERKGGHWTPIEDDIASFYHFKSLNWGIYSKKYDDEVDYLSCSVLGQSSDCEVARLAITTPHKENLRSIFSLVWAIERLITFSIKEINAN